MASKRQERKKLQEDLEAFISDVKSRDKVGIFEITILQEYLRREAWRLNDKVQAFLKDAKRITKLENGFVLIAEITGIYG